MKVMIFVRELLSVVLTPFVLCYSLPNCAPAIIDFFREFTIHVDSLGYVCSFAVFDFKRHGNVHVRSLCNIFFFLSPYHSVALQFGAPTRVKDERFLSKEGKMEKSFLNFKVRVYSYHCHCRHCLIITSGCKPCMATHRPLRLSVSKSRSGL